ncbi:MAG: ATP-binding protein [Anaerolineae bacterium]
MVRLSMRWRIAIPYTAAIVLTLTILSAYLSQQLRQARIEEYRSHLLAEAALVANVLTNVNNSPGSEIGAALLAWSQTFGTRVTLVAPDGKVIADSHSEPTSMDNHLSRPEVQAALANGSGSAIRFSDTLSYDCLYVAYRLPDDTASVRFVRLALPLRDVAASVARLQRALMAAALVASCFVIVLSFAMADRITRPLRRLAATVQSFSKAGANSLRRHGDYDEVQQLAAAFGNMAAQLNARVTSMAEERNRMAMVLAHLADGVVIVDADGQVLLANPAAMRLLGLGEGEQPVGKPIANVVADSNIRLVWQRSHESRQEHEIMIEMPEKGLFMRAVATPIAGARPGGEALVLQDLTQVRRLETVRRDFISNISHELRTPLASLKALVETLQDGALEDFSVAADFLQRMEVEVDALTQMVQELLELSRIESGQVPIRLAKVFVSDIASEPLERLRPQAERKGLTLEVGLPPEDILVLADLERTRQVVTNIVHNAIKFTPSGGKVTLSVAHSGNEVVFSVADTGVGIPPHDLPRIFERFYKADRARASGGTGLGLAIAKHLIQAQGGRIWAESREGRGSTFYFTLLVAK